MLKLKKLVTENRRLLVTIRRDVALDTNLAGQIELDQFVAWIKHSYLMYPIGMAGGFCLLLDFMGKWGNHFVQFSAAFLCVTYLLMIYVSQTWVRRRTKRETYRDLVRIKFRMGFHRFLIGSGWGLFLMSLTTVADSGQLSLIYGTGVALMSTGIFGGSFVYAMSLWIPVTTGFLFSVLYNYDSTGIAPLVCLFLFGMLNFYSIIYLSGKLKALTVNGFELKNRNDVIGLVLNEFEEDSSDWLWQTDPEFNLINISKRLSSVLGQIGVTTDKSVNIRDLILSGVEFSSDGGESETFVQRILAKAPFRRLIIGVRQSDAPVWWSLSGRPTFDKQGVFTGYQGVGSDVTESHGFHQKIDRLARYDALTGLFNRSQFNESLAASFEALTTDRVPFALLTLDMDGFKSINDTYGHDIGDELLVAMAQRISGTLREGDIAARLGGDEFCAIIQCDSKDDALLVSQRIIESLNKVFVLGKLRISAGASAGLAFAPDHGNVAKDLMKHADVALYYAKRHGKSIVVPYHADIEHHERARVNFESELRQAVVNHEFVVHYQPITALADGSTIGVEALVRWNHPTRGLLGPGSFITVAEENGLIEPIGRLVMSQACHDLLGMPDNIKMSINLSPLQLHDEYLVTHLREILRETGLPPARIEFEITESAVLETSGTGSATLQELKALGVRFALDDFGTGHSSLSLLRRFKFDRVKIDRSFTSGMLSDPTNLILVEQIIELSNRLGMDVTAEGIETLQQADFLRKYPKVKIQGHLFGKAVPKAELYFRQPSSNVVPLILGHHTTHGA